MDRPPLDERSPLNDFEPPMSRGSIISLGEETMPVAGRSKSSGGYRAADGAHSSASNSAQSGPVPASGASRSTGPDFRRAPDPADVYSVTTDVEPITSGGGSSSTSGPLTNLAAPDAQRCFSGSIQPDGQRSVSGGALKNLAVGAPIQRQVSPTSSEVILHVYDLHTVTKRMNIGTFHLAVEVYGQEIFFSVEGILSCVPAGHKKHIHKQALPLGRTFLRTHEVKLILDEMVKEWKGNSYAVFGRNCQTFAVAFVESLGLGSDCIPAEYRRQSDLGSGWRDTMIGGAAASMMNRVFGSAGSQSLASGASLASHSGEVCS